MSGRNLAWLVGIVVIAAVTGIAFGWIWAIVAGVVVLVVSELVERAARRRRRQASGMEGVPSPLRNVFAKRRRPGERPPGRSAG